MYLSTPLSSYVAGDYDLYEGTCPSTGLSLLDLESMSIGSATEGIMLRRSDAPKFDMLTGGTVAFRTSAMRRTFVYGLLALRQGERSSFLFINTHLECHQKNEKKEGATSRDFSSHRTGVLQRAAQMKEIKDFVDGYFSVRPDLKFCILVGDMNWDDKNAETLYRPSGSSLGNDEHLLSILDPLLVETPGRDVWRDCWTSSRTADNVHDKSYTYDSLIPMNGGSSACRKRLDRILVYKPEDRNASLTVKGCVIPKESTTLLMVSSPTPNPQYSPPQRNAHKVLTPPHTPHTLPRPNSPRSHRFASLSRTGCYDGLRGREISLRERTVLP